MLSFLFAHYFLCSSGVEEITSTCWLELGHAQGWELRAGHILSERLQVFASLCGEVR